MLKLRPPLKSAPTRRVAAAPAPCLAMTRVRAALVAAGLAISLPMPALAVVSASAQGQAVHARERDELATRLPLRGGSVERFDARRVAVSSSAKRAKAGGTFVTVNTSSDVSDFGYGCGPLAPTGDGLCSLRDAITYVNANCQSGPFTINFSLAPSTTIQPSPYPLDPLFCDNTLIDGESQGGIVLDGSAMSFGGNGLQLIGDGYELNGFTLANMPSDALFIGPFGCATPPATTIRGNRFLGSAGYGIGLGTAECDGNISVEGNIFDGNGLGGIAVLDGSVAISGNVISGNLGPGIDVMGGFVTITGNLIGVDTDGLTPLGNSGDGILVRGFPLGVTIGGPGAGPAVAPSNKERGSIPGLIGPGAGNVIAYNSGNGILDSFSNANILISENEIFANGLLGIDRSAFSEPAPYVVGPITYTATDSTIPWSGSGFFANQSVTVEFFSNDNPLLGVDEGQRWLGSCSTTADPSGVVASCPLTVPGIATNVTTTATLPFGGTSGFSFASEEPGMQLSSTVLAFPSTPLGTTSAPFALTLTNTGFVDLAIDSVLNSSPAEFFDTTGGPPPNAIHYCGLGSDAAGAPLPGPAPSLLSGASCTLNLAFRPLASGTRVGEIKFNDSASPGYTVSVALTGGGGTATPLPSTVSFSPPSLTLPGPVPPFSTFTIRFDNPNLVEFQQDPRVPFVHSLPPGVVTANPPNATSTCQATISILPGATSLALNGLVVPAAGGACEVKVDVTSTTPGVYPTSVAAGALAGALVIPPAGQEPVTNAASATATLAVNAAALALTPPSPLNFGTVSVGSSVPLTVTLANTGSAPLDFSAPFAITGANAADFSFTDTCVPDPLPQLSPGASCTVTITFAPSSVAPLSAIMSFASNALTTPTVLVLGGTGSPTPVPVASLSPTSLVFAAQTVGTTSSPQAATLTNVGTAPLNISGITSTGDFAHSSNCGPALSPSASCTITVTFTPVIAGLRAGDVRVFDDASGSPHILALSGDGVAAAVPAITVVPTSLSFPLTQLGTTTAPAAIVVKNTGSAPLSITGVDIASAGFGIVSDTCNTPVAAGADCTITVVFSPTVEATMLATMRIFSNAPGSPTSVGLSGRGSAVPLATLSVAPSSLAFGVQVVGTTSAPQALTVANLGSATATISGITVSGDFAAQANTCASIPPDGSCTISVTFAPTASGSRSGSVVIAGNASNTPLAIGLSGTGAPPPVPVIELSASSLSFGNTLIGRGLGPQAVEVRNVGGAPLVFSGLLGPFEFPFANGCPGTLDAGQSCRLDVSFLPSVPGPRSGRLDVRSNASNGTKGVSLSGTGCRFSFFNRNVTLICQ